MTATMRRRVPASSAKTERSSGGRHLKLVQYLPAGDEPVVCAAIWSEGDHVHLTAPLLPIRNGVRDPQAYMRQFPQGLASIDAFEDTMTWLDAACYAAADPREVESACEAHPEWQLRCVRYDGSDTTLSGLTGLIHAAEKLGTLPAPVLRDCLLELLKQVLKSNPTLLGAQIEATFRDGDDIATLEIGSDRAVLVTLLASVASTDAIRQGLLAHQRMTEQYKSRVQCLLVAPDLQIDRPMFLTARVAITDMDADHVRAALVQMAVR